MLTSICQSLITMLLLVIEKAFTNAHTIRRVKREHGRRRIVVGSHRRVLAILMTRSGCRVSMSVGVVQKHVVCPDTSDMFRLRSFSCDTPNPGKHVLHGQCGSGQSTLTAG